MRNKKHFINNDNLTMYDEFVCTEFTWLPINKQKENARRLEKLTREEEND